MEQVKLNRVDSIYYCEEDQDVNTLFAFAVKDGDEYNQLFFETRCRDFLTDVYCTATTGIRFKGEIYDFSYDKHLDFDTAYLQVVADSLTNMDGLICLLNRIEIRSGSNLSKLIYTNHGDCVLIAIGGMWRSSSLLLDTLTFLIRLSTYENTRILKHTTATSLMKQVIKKYYKGKDADYCTEVLSNCDIEQLFKRYKAIADCEPLTGLDDSIITEEAYTHCHAIFNGRNISMKDVHNTTGLQSFCKMLGRAGTEKNKRTLNINDKDVLCSLWVLEYFNTVSKVNTLYLDNTIEIESVDYSEDEQSIFIGYSFVERVGDNRFLQFSYPLRCRAVLSCSLWGSHFDLDDGEVYGYSFNTDINKEDLILSVDVDEPDFQYNVIKILREVEGLANIPYTTICGDVETSVHTDNHKLLIFFNKAWVETPIMFSLFTFLLRLAAHPYENKETLREVLNHLASTHASEDASTALNLYANQELLNTVLRNHEYIFRNNPFTLSSDSSLKKELKKYDDASGYFTGVTGVMLPDKISGGLDTFTLADECHYGINAFLKDCCHVNSNLNSHEKSALPDESFKKPIYKVMEICSDLDISELTEL